MPVSSNLGKNEIVEWIKNKKQDIHRILDIGTGIGTYSILLKNAGLRNDFELIGIEIWKPYIEKYQLQSLYDKIYNYDIRTTDWNNLGKFDLIIAGDVLEHMTKLEAENLIIKTLEYGTNTIISIPITYMPQEEFEGNPYEKHVKPDWTNEEIINTWGAYIKNYFIGKKSNGVPRIGVYWLSNEKV